MISSYLKEEIDLRISRISALLAEMGCDAMLVTSNVNLFYTSG